MILTETTAAAWKLAELFQDGMSNAYTYLSNFVGYFTMKFQQHAIFSLQNTSHFSPCPGIGDETPVNRYQHICYHIVTYCRSLFLSARRPAADSGPTWCTSLADRWHHRPPVVAEEAGATVTGALYR